MEKNIIKSFTIIIFCSIIISALFLFIVILNDSIGFPFDDSWIHQVYAKNFALTGKITYNLNQTSLGESSYTWMVILSFAYLINIDPVLYLYVIGLILLIISSILTFNLLLLSNSDKMEHSDNLVSDRKRNYSLLSTFIIMFNPIILWMFFNGMATGLTILLILGSFYSFQKNRIFILNILLFLLFFSRGETIFYCLSIAFTSIYKKIKLKKGKCLSKYTIKCIIYNLYGIIIAVLSYFIFHFSLEKQLFTNTYYLKSLFFGNIGEFLEIFSPVIIGKNLISAFSIENLGLTLMFFLILLDIISNKRNKRNYLLIKLILLFTCVFSYFSQLSFPELNLSPYYLKYWIFIIPLLEIFIFKFLYSVLFNGKSLNSRDFHIDKRNIWSSILIFSFFLLNIINFYPISNQFFVHTNEINSQHKEIGLWLQENTDNDDIIATHDAGAIKFFSNRTVVDIWGLNNQDIFRIYENVSKLEKSSALSETETQILLEDEIWKYLIENNASYLVIREDLFIYLTNFSLHPEIFLVKSFIVMNSIYLGNDVMNLYSIVK